MNVKAMSKGKNVAFLHVLAYLIVVNARSSWQMVLFECLWVPGFYEHESRWKVYPLPVEVLFEGALRWLQLDPPLFGKNPYMMDVLGPHERRVYKIPGEGGPWPVPELFDTCGLVVEPVNQGVDSRRAHRSRCQSAS